MSDNKTTDSVENRRYELTGLLPCPFCGGKAEIWRAHPENPKRNAWIACIGRCAVLTKEFGSTDEAIKTWNTRTR